MPKGSKFRLTFFFNLATLAATCSRAGFYHNIFEGSESMKKALAATSLSLLFFVSLIQVAPAEGYSCTATDSGCLANISFPGGGFAVSSRGDKSHLREGRYQIVENDKEVATIAIYETHQEIVITVDRTTAPQHRFRYLRYPGLLVGEAGNDFVFAYVCSETLRNFKMSDGKLPKMPLPGLTLGNPEAAKAYFSDDMPWLRMIAEIDPRSLYAECFYVLATKDIPNLEHSIPEAAIKVQEKANLGDYQDCLKACRNLRESCVRNVPPGEIINCYLIEGAGINNCSKVAQPIAPPGN
jgi:hypothetical protein